MQIKLPILYMYVQITENIERTVIVDNVSIRRATNMLLLDCTEVEVGNKKQRRRQVGVLTEHSQPLIAGNIRIFLGNSTRHDRS